MLNHSETGEDYILGYSIVDGSILEEKYILVTYGDKLVEMVNYTPEKEEEIRNQMLEQAKNMKQKLEYRPSGFYSFLIAVWTFNTAVYIHNHNTPAAILGAANVALAGVSEGLSLKKALEIYNDAKKHKIYLEDGEKINEGLKGLDHLPNFSKSIKSAMEDSIRESHDPVDINNLDSFSLNDLKKLRKEYATEKTYSLNGKKIPTK